METDRLSRVFDWLKSVSAGANSLLNLDSIQGLAGPPKLSQFFPTCSSPIPHIRHPSSLCTTRRMADQFSNNGFTLYELNGQSYSYIETQAIETPASSGPNQSLRAPSTESPSHHPPLRSGKLQFLNLDEWDERNSYNKDKPSYLYYSIE